MLVRHGKRERVVPTSLCGDVEVQTRAALERVQPTPGAVWPRPGREYEPDSEAGRAEETELLAGLAKQNAVGLGLLFERFAGPVLAVARRILQDYSEAEEVVQEVFLYLYVRPQLFDAEKGSARSWILRLALSRALDRKLYLARRGFYAGVDFHVLDNTAISKGDLEGETRSRLNRKHLEEALAQLPVKQRKTIECFYFEGLELREISDRMSEPLGNVRHYLYRGLARLRKSSLLGKL